MHLEGCTIKDALGAKLHKGGSCQQPQDPGRTSPRGQWHLLQATSIRGAVLSVRGPCYSASSSNTAAEPPATKLPGKKHLKSAPNTSYRAFKIQKHREPLGGASVIPAMGQSQKASSPVLPCSQRFLHVDTTRTPAHSCPAHSPTLRR